MHETRPKFIRQYTKLMKCIYTIKPSKRDANEKNQVPFWVQIHQGSITNIVLHRFLNVIFFFWQWRCYRGRTIFIIVSFPFVFVFNFNINHAIDWYEGIDYGVLLERWSKWYKRFWRTEYIESGVGNVCLNEFGFNRKIVENGISSGNVCI